jgi:hypothetical protein
MMSASPPAESADSESVPSELASRLAVLSFAAGLIFCCPLTGLLAMSSGAAALFFGHTQSVASWRKYAWGGILLGLIGTIATPLLAWGVSGWWDREGRILFSGPNNALFALYQGDSDAFLDEFMYEGQRPSETAVAAFKEALETRHGEFMRCLSDQPPELEGAAPWTLDDYTAQFSTADGISEVPVSIGLIRTPSDSLSLVWVEFDSGSETPLRFPMMNKESDG